MIDRSPTRAHYSSGQSRHASIYNGATFGLTWGDLRKLVSVVADAIPDEAEVEFEEVSRDSLRVNRYHAKRIVIDHTDRPEYHRTLDVIPEGGNDD